MMIRRTVVVAALAALVLPGQGHAWSIPLPGDPDEQHATGRVTGVADGDTMYVEIAGKSTRVRLAEIDAPEKAQPFGRRSEQALRDLVAKKVVTLSWRSIDPYGRPVVYVRVGTLNVNAEQVKRGYAWVYRQFSHDSNLITDEGQARASRLGLWADSHPVPPWDWRKDHKGR